MQNEVQTQEKKNAPMLVELAERFGINPAQAFNTIKNTIAPKATNDELMAFCIVANQYQLNPFTREIYAFPNKAGGIVPIVGIDGWLRIINSHPQFDGMQVAVSSDGEEATCTIYRKDMTHPTIVTEYFSECKRATEPWKTHPKRMLRHKAIIQCGRVAFGFSGIFDEEEGADVAGIKNVTPQQDNKPKTPHNPFAVERDVIDVTPDYSQPDPMPDYDQPDPQPDYSGDFIPGLEYQEEVSQLNPHFED